MTSHPFSSTDISFCQHALNLASKAIGQTSPNPLVGAVIVKDNMIVGEGWHKYSGGNHAEIEAVLNANGKDLSGSTIYVNLEPCSHFGKTPPCTETIIRQGIKRIVCCTEDPNPVVSGKGILQLRDAGIQVDVGICSREALRLNETFFTFHKLKRPFISCKWAMTLDGRIATDLGHSQWITNDESRDYVHHLRATHDAIMVGVGTVIYDDPQLSVRLKDYAGKQPKRIICDGYLRTPIKAKCLRGIPPEDCIFATTERASDEHIKKFTDAGHTVLVLGGNQGFVNMRELFGALYVRNILSVFCEGGSTINGALLSTGLCDKLHAFIAPKLIGGKQGRTPITGWGVSSMAEAFPLVETSIKTFKGDICVEGYIFGLFGKAPQYAANFKNHNEPIR